MQKRSEETHTQILESAHLLFSQAGYEAASVADICQEAGVSKGAFYHHFPTKQAVFLELLEGWLVELERGFAILQEESETVPQAIDAMASIAGQLLEEMNGNLSLLPEFWIQAQRDPQVWQAARSPYQRYQRFFSTLIHKGIQDGALAQVDSDLAARSLVSLALGLLMQATFDPHGADWGKETQRSIHLFINALRVSSQ